MTLKTVASGVLIALVNGLVLAAGLGYVGASRAFILGPSAFFLDNPGPVVLASAVAMGMAAVFSIRLRSVRQLGWLVLSVAVSDFLAAAAVTLLIPELELIHAPRAFATVTSFGVQLIAVATGTLVGYGVGRGRNNASLPSLPAADMPGR
jgi:hypothetical protein